MVALLVGACGGSDQSGDELPGSDQQAQVPDDAPARTEPGSFELAVTADGVSDFTGEARFVVDDGDLVIRLDGATNEPLLEVYGIEAHDEGPAAGTLQLSETQGDERTWGAVLLLPGNAGDAPRYAATSGALTLTSVTPGRIVGEVSFSAAADDGGDPVWVSGTFAAVCDDPEAAGDACW
ncbi:MAG: hypothetical protein ACOC5E_02775 [Acidobacteriota bacterium]